MKTRVLRTLGGVIGALGDFLRGFLGLAGAGGPPPDDPAQATRAATPAGAREALAERAEHRKNCC